MGKFLKPNGLNSVRSLSRQQSSLRRDRSASMPQMPGGGQRVHHRRKEAKVSELSTSSYLDFTSHSL